MTDCSRNPAPAGPILVVSRNWIADPRAGGAVNTRALVHGLRRSGRRVHYAVINPNLHRDGPPRLPRGALAPLDRPDSVLGYVGAGPWFLRLTALPWLAASGLFLPARPFLDRMAARIPWAKPRRCLRRLGGHGFARAGWDSRPADRLEQQSLTRLIRSLRPSAVILDYCWLMPALDILTGLERPLIACNTHDAMHETRTRWIRIGLAADGFPDRATEFDWLDRADVLIANNPRDAEVFRMALPHRRVVMCRVWAEPEPLPASAQVAGRCLFVGANAEMNADALEWLLHAIWPRVRAEMPGAQLHVCGGVCRRSLPALPGVVLRGELKDLRPEYAAAQAALAPLRVGSGAKVKLIEAVRFGRAAVSSAIGLEGLEILEGKCVLRADSPHSFAQAVLRLLRDDGTRRDAEREAAVLAQTHFSIDRCIAPLLEVLGSPLPNRRCAFRGCESNGA